jgi:hypothetical protein
LRTRVILNAVTLQDLGAACGRPWTTRFLTCGLGMALSPLDLRQTDGERK